MIKKILIIEDDVKIGQILQMSLTKEGYLADVSLDGTEGYEKFKSGSYSLILLDLMLPGISGRDLCAKIRRESNIPIIILTAKDELFTKVELLDIGADDYLTKPFEMDELFARIRVTFRNKENFSNDGIIRFKEIEIHQNTRKIVVEGSELKITKKEFNLMEYFVRNKGIVLSREKIMDEVWGWDSEVDYKIVDIYINSLRKKIVQCQVYIKSIRGIGYIFGND